MKMHYGYLLIGLVLVIPAQAQENGKAIYDKNCKVCHDSGMAGAPKAGLKPDWEDRMAGGLDYLVKNAIDGKQGYGGMMPPRGGNPKLSDQEVREAVSYMLGLIK